MEAINEKARKAARMYLERRNYEVVEEGWANGDAAVDLIARDGEDLVFVDVHVNAEGTKLPDEHPDRARFEAAAAVYLASCDEVDFPVRYDVVSLLVVGSERALLRHHINALSALE